MIRTRTVVTALAAGSLLLGACSGNQKASQGDVKNEVVDQLTEVGFVAAPDAEPIEVSASDADDIGDCVSEGLFDPDQFTVDERDAATSTNDPDEPDPDLVVKVEDLTNGCFDEVTGGTADESATSDEPSGADDEETTTTEG